MGLFERLHKRKTKDELISVSNQEKSDLLTLSEAILLDTQTDITSLNTVSVPIGKMASLGGVVASLIPAMRTVTQSTSINTTGLYRLANESVGDVLKKAKNGNSWGAFKTASGKSKFVQLTEAGPLTTTSQTVMPIDPATMMMAAALYSIEQKLDKIVEMERQIISFLQEEKESQIEGDLKTLTNILQEYKYNWEDEKYRSNHHKLALDIKRSMEQNIIFYQKQLTDVKSKNHIIVGKTTIDTVNENLQKKLKYYRLSLYIYSLASVLEMMLLGNFQEEYLGQIKNKIEKYSLEYRDVFAACSEHLETVAKGSIGNNALKGLGVVENALGNFIGNIPGVREGQVDEWLIRNGSKHKETAQELEKDAVKGFAAVSNPGTSVFIEKLNDMSRIYNYTEQIYFDNNNIYLVVR